MIPTATADVTYFASNGHRFGYGGIQQVDSNTGRVIFSVWDQGGCDQDVDPNCSPDNIAQFTACGEGVTCTSFGGEGTGRKSYFDILGSFPIVGEEYYFVTQAEYLGNRRMEYTGYFFMGGSWRLLSRIQVSTNVNEEWWLGGLYSFVEQWTTVDTTTKDRSALYGPSFLASSDGSNLVQINTATFTHGTLENHEHVNAWQAGAEQDYAVGIATGGNVFRYASNGQQFSYKAITPDAELLDFVQRIPCLNDANSKGEIESCVKDEEPPTVVNCGGHTAPSCAKCPQGNGEAWCNGECQWFNNECVEQRPCEDSSDWTFKQRNGNIRNCKWVGRKTKRRCRKIGEDGTTAYEGCPKSCGSC